MELIMVVGGATRTATESRDDDIAEELVTGGASAWTVWMGAQNTLSIWDNHSLTLEDAV